MYRPVVCSWPVDTFQPVFDVNDICEMCEEPIDAGSLAEAQPIGTPEGRRLAHRECLLRNVLGGIGHLEDHNHWCNEMHDPDGGRSYRQSALEVDAWVHRHGVSAAAAIKP